MTYLGVQISIMVNELLLGDENLIITGITIQKIVVRMIGERFQHLVDKRKKKVILVVMLSLL